MRSARGKMAQWFWFGLGGWLVGGLLLLAESIGGGGSLEGIAGASMAVIAGWSAMLVGVIGKGVELGVRAASDE